MRRIIVVGASLAGARAAETLRRRGFEGELIVVGNEPHRPYDRPPLSKAVLAGHVGPEAIVRPCDAEAQWLIGRTAEALDVHRRVVTLDGGDEIAFDGLVIATGSRAREWPRLPELEGFHYLRRIEDSIALRDAVVRSPRVCIVGAGFIGCEVAATLRARGLAVTVADVAPHPMPALGREVGERCRALHEAHGVHFALESAVAAFHGVGRVEAVEFAGGERVAADLVLLAVGAVPNVEWLAGSGLRLDRGVVCDKHSLAVGAANIAAAGDVARWPHPAAGGMARIEHWSNASAQGAAAAANLLSTAAERKPYAPVPTFWSDQYDVKVQSVGFVDRATTVEIVEELSEENRLVAEARRRGKLVGAITFNHPACIADHRRALADADAGVLVPPAQV